jgi:hypothetical protein
MDRLEVKSSLVSILPQAASACNTARARFDHLAIGFQNMVDRGDVRDYAD